jgi:hypothetical protein
MHLFWKISNTWEQFYGILKEVVVEILVQMQQEAHIEILQFDQGQLLSSDSFNETIDNLLYLVTMLHAYLCKVHHLFASKFSGDLGKKALT